MAWGALVLRVPQALEDALAGGLGPGALGLETRFEAPGRVHLRVFYASVERAGGAVAEAVALLRSLGTDPAECRLAVEVVADERWAERWQEGLQAFPLGERFAVHPTGMVEEAHAERIPILLVPGRAFGTGEHPTTRLAAAALERYVEPGSRWLDLGTGTGLLALIALRLGASTVVARDDDPEAVEVARETLRAHAAGEAVRLELGSMNGLPRGAFQGIAANIVAPFFLEHAGVLVSLLEEGGVLLATGLLEEEAPAVAAGLAGAGLQVKEKAAAGPWSLLVARRERMA